MAYEALELIRPPWMLCFARRECCAVLRRTATHRTFLIMFRLKNITGYCCNDAALVQHLITADVGSKRSTADREVSDV